MAIGTEKAATLTRRNARLTFAEALVRGLNISGLVAISGIAAPRAPATSMRSDWEAIGGDVRSALVKYAARRTA